MQAVLQGCNLNSVRTAQRWLCGLQEITKRFPGVTALDRVDLDLHRGESPRPGWREWRWQIHAHQDS